MKYVTPVLLAAVLSGWLIDAISRGSLIPSPKVGYEVLEIHRFAGHFYTAGPATTDEAERKKLAQHSKRLRAAISAEVERVRRDLSAWADVVIRPDGTMSVLGVQGDPELVQLLDAPTFERWLDADGFRYDDAPGTDAPRAGANHTLRICIEALHRAPYIWFIRLLLAFVTLAFLMMIHSLWRRRGKRRVDSGPGAAGNEEGEVPA